jgi:hypothetical protein
MLRRGGQVDSDTALPAMERVRREQGEVGGVQAVLAS